jgi:hypothetical protein
MTGNGYNPSMETQKKPGRPPGKKPRAVLTIAIDPSAADRLRKWASGKRWTIRAAVEDLIERGVKP